MSKIKTVIGLGMIAGGMLYSMAPNNERGRRVRLRPFENTRIAHRGLFDNMSDWPENSIPAFRRAMSYHFGIELDVRLTKDEVPIVFHDENLKRACGVDRYVADCTFYELQKYHLFGTFETIPKFSDVLKEIGGEVPLVIEIKAEYDVVSICKKVMRELYSYPGIYCIESFSPFVLKWFKDHEPNVLRGQLAMDFFDPDENIVKPWPIKFTAKNLMGNLISRPDFISYKWKGAKSFPMLVSRKIFEAKTAAWTIRSQEELEFADEYFDMIIFEGFIPEEMDGIKEDVTF